MRRRLALILLSTSKEAGRGRVGRQRRQKDGIEEQMEEKNVQEEEGAGATRGDWGEEAREGFAASG